MTKERGQLIVFSGPSGVGKGTILAQYMKGRDNICYSVSATTRAPRPGEVDGQHYFYLTKEKFEEMINNGDMLEYTCYNGNFYGTPKSSVESVVSEGYNIILDIEVEGAANMKKKFPQAISIFILPPDMQTLYERLSGRGTEDEETINRRIARAKEELELRNDYDFKVVNDTVDQAVDEIRKIISL